MRTHVVTALSLLLVLVLHWQLSHALRNDAFVDEATYIVSGQQLAEAAQHGAAPPPIATYLSGAPHLYPRLAAVLYASGGLEGVRTFSLICLLVAIVAVCSAAQQLFASRVAGIAAAALFAVQAPVLFLSRFATYDAPSVALLALALALAVDRRERSGTATAVLAGLAIGAAAMVKYAALLYAPGIVLVCALAATGRARWTRGVLAGIGAVTAVVGLALLDDSRAMWTGFVTTTLSRSVTSGGDVRALIGFALTLGGAVATLAIPGLAVATPRMRWVALCIFASALLAPLNHVRLHEFVSLHKHMAFALVLFASLAGGAVDGLLHWLRKRWARNDVVIASAVAAAAIAIVARAIVQPGLAESRRLFRYWPDNTQRAYATLAPVVSDSARFLAEEPDLGALYLVPPVPAAHWVHPYFFDYAGESARTPGEIAPFRRAIRDGYFTAVVLRFGPQRTWALAMEEELLHAQPRYRLAAKLPFELSDGAGAYQLWVRADAPGADQVR